MTPIRVADLVSALERAGLLVGTTEGIPDAVDAVTDDSRAVREGTAFVAVRGADRDGHDYLDAAAQAGATLAVVEDPARTSGPALVVHSSRRAAAVVAAAAHGHPARTMRFVGVTGTNGKTTTVGMLRHLLDEADARAASIGTLGVLVGSAGAELPGGGGLTTPGPMELQRLLRLLADQQVRVVAMEVSSHALHQERVMGIAFDAAVFTNLTRDHLDYHGTMEAYFEAKARLIALLGDDGAAVVNADDRAWDALPAAPRRLTFGERAPTADVRARDVTFHPRGSDWTLVSPDGEAHVQLPVIGDFNVANALGAAATAVALGIPVRTVAERLSTLPQVPGRLEIIAERPTTLRDYAHTPDALERALTALRPFTPGRLIVVFGAGGDRDRGKRPLMAQIADRLADVLVVTSDNPRTEDPERILDDIVAPLEPGRYERIQDRRTAIARALAIADPAQDVVLLAGKGHETYQIRGTEKLPFDERAIVAELLATRSDPGARP